MKTTCTSKMLVTTFPVMQGHTTENQNPKPLTIGLHPTQGLEILKTLLRYTRLLYTALQFHQTNALTTFGFLHIGTLFLTWILPCRTPFPSLLVFPLLSGSSFSDNELSLNVCCNWSCIILQVEEYIFKVLSLMKDEFTSFASRLSLKEYFTNVFVLSVHWQGYDPW